MKALELLLTRSSQPRLTSPAPDGEVLENIMQSALRAPDHAGLTPWRFIICKEDGLEKLGQIFEKAAIESNMDENNQLRAPKLPLRAPMVIVAIAKHKEHEKVPWVEQVASTSCAVQAMQMAAVAQGFSGIWRTGSYAQNTIVKEQFALQEKDEIVGFLYLGSTVTKPVSKPLKNTSDYFEFWQ